MGQMSHLKDHSLSNLSRLGSGRNTRACVEELGGGISEGPKERVGKDASIGILSKSIFWDVSTEAGLLLSASSCVYLASTCLMLVDDEGVTSISLVTSRETQAH